MRVREGPLPLTDRLRDAFETQLTGLAEPARTVLLVAAADGTGDLGPILRAAGTLGASLADLDQARAAGLVEVTGEHADLPSPADSRRGPARRPAGAAAGSPPGAGRGARCPRPGRPAGLAASRGRRRPGRGDRRRTRARRRLGSTIAAATPAPCPGMNARLSSAATRWRRRGASPSPPRPRPNQATSTRPWPSRPRAFAWSRRRQARARPRQATGIRRRWPGSGRCRPPRRSCAGIRARRTGG